MTRRSQVLMYSYKQTIQQYFRSPNTCLLAWFLYQGTIRQLCHQVHQRPECLTVTSHQGPAAWKPVQLSVAWPQIWLDARSLGHRRIYIFLTVAWFEARFSVNGRFNNCLIILILKALSCSQVFGSWNTVILSYSSLTSKPLFKNMTLVYGRLQLSDSSLISKDWL